MAIVTAKNDGQDPSGYSNSNDYDLIEGIVKTWTEKPLGKGHIKVTRSGAYSITVWREDDKGAFKDKTLELYESSVSRLSKKYKFDRPYIEKEYVEMYYVNIGDLPTDESEEHPSYTCTDTNGKEAEKPVYQWEAVLYLSEGDYYIKWDTGYDYPQKVLFECNVDTLELRYDLPWYLDIDSEIPENSCYGVFWAIKDEFLKHKVGKYQYKYLPYETTEYSDLAQFQIKYIFYMDKILAGVFYYMLIEYIAMDKYKKKSWMDKAWKVLFKIIDSDNKLTKDEKEFIQSCTETSITTAIGISYTATGVYLTIALFILNQDPKYLLPEIADSIMKEGEVINSSYIKQTKYPIILKIGDKLIIDYEGNRDLKTSAICEKWTLKETKPIKAWGSHIMMVRFPVLIVVCKIYLMC